MAWDWAGRAGWATGRWHAGRARKLERTGILTLIPVRGRLRRIHVLTARLTQCGSNPPVTSYESASQRIKCLSFRPAGSGVETGAPQGLGRPGSVLQHARAENYLLLRFQARAKKNIQLQLEAERGTGRARDPVSPAVSTPNTSPPLDSRLIPHK